MNLFCVDFNIELSLSSYILSAILVLVLRIGCFRSRVYSNSGSLKQEVWGRNPLEAISCLVSELPKIQDFECISQITKT